MPWYVVYTKPNNEKKVAQLLDKKGIETYCPVEETIKQWSDRKKKIQTPLFRSYIFVFLNDYDGEKVEVLMLPGVVRFLFWLGKPGIVKENEIKAIREFISQYKGSNITVQFNPGDIIGIKEGPLTGQSATVISIRGNKAILLLKSLKMNLTAEVNTGALISKSE